MTGLITQNFPMSTPPVHPGVYAVVPGFGCAWYSYWDGSIWFSAGLDCAGALSEYVARRKSISCYDGWFVEWYGSAEIPEGHGV